jgi:hypothetical protein
VTVTNRETGLTAPLNYFRRSLSFGDFVPNLIRQQPKSWLLGWPGLLFVVAALVIVSSGLSLLGNRESKPSFAGIILLIVAAIGMPWLASKKRKLATRVASA